MTKTKTETRAEPMIRLDQLTKAYDGQAAPAVDRLTLDIPAGEIVVLVGPSGCGKTTTMKLINRLIEPTSGRIHLDGKDVTDGNPDMLRRRIGYSIQQTGLFPHRTVADNIATVPRMLGWPRDRVAARVDELLALVGLDPDTFRRRFPKQLSGGEQQRVGVARALGGDPQVMLMDEPFGAIDPLNRASLQNEFLRIQAELRKTIVFVTHDIDEAVKMGDRIAIFSSNGKVEQYDTPERILSEPVNDFVAGFIGRGAAVRRLSLSRLADVDVPGDWPTLADGASSEERRRAAAAANGREFLLVLDGDRRPVGWLPTDGAADGEGAVPVLSPLGPRDTLYDALDQMLTLNAAAAVVTHDDGRYRGVLELDSLRTLIHAERAGAMAAPGHREVR
ncbi:ABC transporter ATP-binding protein [Streptomyces sp. DG2A-72]|uniref:ABC transporter ATP-binding protein n=1 Tax=Streptomyces sp. DG2A-72 TaxID=3051386 RepID=UPI00265BD2CE|nr:ABC transporter ATP-binding protein [Streptomyces sp. DG2A-72]MDO0931136.1 ABC transporter ATP-binding protein [Streptomyces sp. DG2A-72]